ncbi:SUMF1/EgtB/PvdO family nonheme iron enzyme [Planctomycetota bacterium]
MKQMVNRIVLCLVVLTSVAYASESMLICGEWTGIDQLRGKTQSTAQNWILTFRPDESFSLRVVEDDRVIKWFDGAYRVSETNISIEDFMKTPITIDYSITGEKLTIAFSKAMKQLRWGTGVDSYIRTRKLSELKPEMKQKLLREGRYTFTVMIDKGNNESSLMDVFGKEYKKRLKEPIEVGTYMLQHLQNRNLLQLSGETFEAPEFNGSAFKVFGRIAPNLEADFLGETVSPTLVQGSFKSRSSSLHGTFTIERVATRGASRNVIIESIAARSEQMKPAIKKMMAKYKDDYPRGEEFLQRLESARSQEELKALQYDVLLAHPLLDDAKVILLRRNIGETSREILDRIPYKPGNGINLGLPWRNTHDNTTIAHSESGWDNDIITLSGFRERKVEVNSLYKPASGAIMADLELHFDADRLMFSSIGTGDRWRLFEMSLDTCRPVEMEVAGAEAEDFFDSCYLPDGRVICGSTIQMSGVPCEGGGPMTAVPVLYNPKDKSIRQLGFDQDSCWNFSLMNDGRVLYTRWEYTDLAHFFSRIVFTCNPDGTNQRAYYGSNSYWPNSVFGVRTLPGNSMEFVGTVTGHHGQSRMGRLMVFSPSQGTHEADGVVHAIPGNDKVDPVIEDRLYNNYYPKALTPWPVDESHFLTIMKPTPNSLWGLYLVDTFDNIVLLYEEEGMFFLDPFLLEARPTPPRIPDRIRPEEKTATVFIQNIYRGPGLKGIAPDSVKELRVLTYNFSTAGSASHDDVGIESSWDVKAILGTVPVEEDGSVMFEAPANTPLSLQPLDKDGAALQLFRSWFTPMPGEMISCIGCHESASDAPSTRLPSAARKGAVQIKPWQDSPPRPFGFMTEVQPILNQKCSACHNAKDKAGGLNFKKDIARGTMSGPYRDLQKYVRRPGPESDLHMFYPMEYHASTSELIQMLKEGHHNVTLSNDQWRTIYAWIDLNVPYNGSLIDKNRGTQMGSSYWKYYKFYTHMDSPQEALGQDCAEGISGLYQRRLKNYARYANRFDDLEKAYNDYFSEVQARQIDPVKPASSPEQSPKEPTGVAGWPFYSNKAAEMQRKGQSRSLEVGKHRLKLAYIPAGAFVTEGKKLSVSEPFWISTTEISNELYAEFDPEHDSRYRDLPGKDQKSRGIPLNEANQPVVRITFEEAMQFCQWLSEKSGMKVSLPDRSQWEWAARAGSATPYWFGDFGTDYAGFANFAENKGGATPLPPARYALFKDSGDVSSPVGGNAPNPWGLMNVLGNVAEWVKSDSPEMAWACGGSWRDRPFRCTSSFALPYQSYQKVYNVGFRVIVINDTESNP